ncbi:hypothetical protein [Roseibacillus persicicus]|uniref:Elongation factor GreAB n=1 Tax=Roseibacillus persicicus TaxID=454148 RepID=A0A918TIY7_9BACT|nr:hypothetical protein [Roseibacillus persicicus]GHC44242.1 elongation factor GreAB [Roseibacillus persicicus]
MLSAKAQLLTKVIAVLREEHEEFARVLADTSAAATDPDSKAESKYDTRSLEMSYLAAGQAKQAEQLVEALDLLEKFELPEFAVSDPIDLGALVELELEGVWSFYFLLPAGGGIEVSEGEISATTLTPESPLFSLMKGKRIGEPLENGATVSEVS